MEPSIIIELCNFQGWKQKRIELKPGITLLSGKSGSGKSTICRAIHFVLFGGRSWHNIGNKDMPTTTRTWVQFIVTSPIESYCIRRERPTETITVEILRDDQQIRYTGDSAQNWIESIFGTEKSWLCSSYLIQDNSHFFIGASNIEKKELLHQITFGEMTDFTPELIIAESNSKLTLLKTRLSQYNSDIKMRTELSQNIIDRTPDVNKYADFTEELVLQLKTELALFYENRTKYEISLQMNRKRLNDETELRKLELMSTEFDKNVNSEKINRLKQIQRCQELKKRLVKFDAEILNCDPQVISKDEYLYNLYLANGWNPEIEIDLFLKKCKDDFEDYRKYQRFEKEISKIREHNQNVNDTNRIREKSYQIQQQQFLEKMREIDKYNRSKERAEFLQREVIDINYLLFEEDDDGTTIFLQNAIARYIQSNRELQCPHCGQGVIFENCTLQKGSVEFDEVRKANNKSLALAPAEMEKRKNRESALLEICRIEKMIRPNDPEKPEEPVYLQLKEEPNIKIVIEPTLKTFEKPTNSYEIVIRYIESFKLIPIFNELNDNPFRDENVEVNLDIEITNLEKKQSQFEQIELKIEFLKEQLSKMPEMVPDCEKMIADISTKIQKIQKKIDISGPVMNLAMHSREINRLMNERDITITEIDELIGFIKFTTMIANTSVTDTIQSINLNLEQITDEIFDRGIKVDILTTKECKNGNEKDVVNLRILYEQNQYNSPSELSGGEQRRISLALMLAFSKINLSPICILDEVLPAMESELKSLALETIKEWTKGKFVIHICHEVTEGFHDNVEYI